jgi:hypothetical protein
MESAMTHVTDRSLLLIAVAMTATLSFAAPEVHAGKPVRDGSEQNGKALGKLKQASRNSSPNIAGDPPTSTVEGSYYEFLPTANDPDGDTLLFSIVNQPAWISFDPGTGAIYGTPGPGQTGLFPAITISVSDGLHEASLSAFDISVEVLPGTENSPPALSGNPVTRVNAGEFYEFTPDSSDADGDALQFSITNRPTWALFDRDSGLMSGVPTADDVGVQTAVQISVSDGQDTVSLPAFDLEVVAQSVPENAPPTIAGDPPGSVVAGEFYGFTPQATDPDNDALIFSGNNIPGWATLDTGTGALYGSPGQNDVGQYENIAIDVSDGQTNASLPSFSIVVAEGSLDPVTIYWQPPTTNSDGSTLLDLAGFRIYGGDQPDNLELIADLDNPGITNYVIEGLTPTTWYFAVSAYNDGAVESDTSELASLTP